MTYPFRIETIYGAEQFHVLEEQRTIYKNNGCEAEFKERCKSDAARVSKYLDYFLEDDGMMTKYPMSETDSDGWQLYRQMSDLISGLNYFSGKVM